MKKAKLFIAALIFLVSAAIAGAQNINVSGTVVDSHSGEAITGAAVQLKGSSTKYSMTDIDGRYSLTAVPSNGTLVVSLLGYTTAEIEINGRARIDINLTEDAELL